MDVRAQVKLWHDAHQTIALVPTMGALHEGHLSLVRHAKTKADRVIVYIFVNPKQFNDPKDYDHYPRNHLDDLDRLKREGVDLVYAPTLLQMYPDDFATNIHVSGITEHMEGAVRPGHFDGVATVVCKLLLQVMPDIAIFGEKDYQQLCLIRQLVRDLTIPVEIEGAATMRDEDGLALSSRNVFLSAQGLKQAKRLNKVLFDLAAQVAKGDVSTENAQNYGRDQLNAMGFQDIEYIELRSADHLQEVSNDNQNKPMRLLAAVRVEGIRLIDNVAVDKIN